MEVKDRIKSDINDNCIKETNTNKKKGIKEEISKEEKKSKEEELLLVKFQRILTSILSFSSCLKQTILDNKEFSIIEGKESNLNYSEKIKKQDANIKKLYFNFTAEDEEKSIIYDFKVNKKIKPLLVKSEIYDSNNKDSGDRDDIDINSIDDKDCNDYDSDITVSLDINDYAKSIFKKLYFILERILSSKNSSIINIDDNFDNRNTSTLLYNQIHTGISYCNILLSSIETNLEYNKISMFNNQNNKCENNFSIYDTHNLLSYNSIYNEDYKNKEAVKFINDYSLYRLNATIETTEKLQELKRKILFKLNNNNKNIDLLEYEKNNFPKYSEFQILLINFIHNIRAFLGTIAFSSFYLMEFILKNFSQNIISNKYETYFGQIQGYHLTSIERILYGKIIPVSSVFDEDCQIENDNKNNSLYNPRLNETSYSDTINKELNVSKCSNRKRSIINAENQIYESYVNYGNFSVIQLLNVFLTHSKEEHIYPLIQIFSITDIKISAITDYLDSISQPSFNILLKINSTNDQANFLLFFIKAFQLHINTISESNKLTVPEITLLDHFINKSLSSFFYSINVKSPLSDWNLFNFVRIIDRNLFIHNICVDIIHKRLIDWFRIYLQLDPEEEFKKMALDDKKLIKNYKSSNNSNGIDHEKIYTEMRNYFLDKSKLYNTLDKFISFVNWGKTFKAVIEKLTNIIKINSKKANNIVEKLENKINNC